jgi:hypothetical protein
MLAYRLRDKPRTANDLVNLPLALVVELAINL